MSVYASCKQEHQDEENDKGSPNSCVTSVNTELDLMIKKQRFSCSFEIGDDESKRKKGEEVESSDDEDFPKSTVEDEEDDDQDGEEVESGLNGALGSMSSLEESLPIKRGLSKFYGGKSRSFANLMEIRRVEDVTKPEHPFNKRKRILRTSRFHSAVDLCSMHVVGVDDDNEDEQGYSNVKKTKTDTSMHSNLFC
ncbi:hypothetical protein ACHQM5_030519 [Ranunculus cassubicifolius]